MTMIRLTFWSLFCLLMSRTTLALNSNDTELLAFYSVQAPSLPELQQELWEQINGATADIVAVPGVFAQQNGTEPGEGSLQLPDFGALYPWNSILNMLTNTSSRILIVLVRHGKAWENVNPTRDNSLCEFQVDGETIQNFDSELHPEGIEQAQSLNALFHTASPGSGSNWFETIGLSQAKLFLTSPLSRTLQTANNVFMGLPVSEMIASELIRANIGHDVCNVRKSTVSSTSDNNLPSPWRSGCEYIPTDSLTGTFSKTGDNPNINVNFKFPIRPAGGKGFGLISDADTLWRSDMVDNSNVYRAKAFLSQLFGFNDQSRISASTDKLPVFGIVTHGEVIDAIYQAAGIVEGYSPRNTQVVPLLLERRSREV